MKTIIKLKTISTIMLFTMGIFIFNGCKKTGLKADTDKTGESDLDRAKANVEKRIAELGGRPEIFTVNKKMVTTWADKNGIPINPKLSSNSIICTNYDLPDFTELISYQRIYDCNIHTNNSSPGYYIQFEYNVSWSKNIVGTNANSVSTLGFIEITDDATGTITTNYTASGADVTITDLGVGPYAPNHVYNVKFNYGRATHSSNPIPTGYINGDINGTYTVKLGATFATDCPDSYALWILPANWFGFTGNTGEHPCNRNDYAIWQPPSIFGSGDKFGISGYDPSYVCSEFGGSFVRTHFQEVQYSLDGGTFVPFTLVLGGGSTSNPILQFGFINNFDFVESPSVTTGVNHDIILRFRNWYYPGGIPSPLTTPPTLLNACRSIGDGASPSTDASTWAYEYHLNETF